jgi:glycosyltransferase involved in cell wall biosynthesis
LASRFIKKKPPVVVSERFYDPPSGASFLEKLTRALYIFANHITVNSVHQTQNLCRRYPWLKKKISTIYNGYDLDKFSPQAVTEPNRPLKALVIASISPYKNGLCLVRALNILNYKYQLKIQVSWAGEQMLVAERLAYRKQMDHELEKYGLTDCWEWLGQRADIPELLRSHDVLVHPSYGEGLPNAVCEALACGRPVIVSKTLDHPILVEDGVTGILFDWTSPDSLAESIERFSAMTPSERQAMGSRARLYAEKNLSLSVFADKYQHLFQGLVI